MNPRDTGISYTALREAPTPHVAQFIGVTVSLCPFFLSVRMMRMLVVIIISTICAGADASSYLGAVVEHAVQGSADASLEAVLNENLDIYESLIARAADYGAQVIVFPEFGLAPVDDSNRTALAFVAESVPSPEEAVQMRQPYSKTLQPILARLSAAAKKHALPVLVNMVDSVPCSSGSDCADDGVYLYNTNVLLDATGALVARYHKSNEWPGLMPPYDQVAEGEYATWTAPFGVQFGIFTCFDILWHSPAVDYVDAGISHFLYPVQQGQIGEDTVISHWSKKYSATVLSSNLATDRRHDCSDVMVDGEKLAQEAKLYAVSPAKDGHGTSNVVISRVPM